MRSAVAVGTLAAMTRPHTSTRRQRSAVPLAARAGRWSARHRKTAIFGWFAFVVLATLVGGAVGQRNVPRSQLGNGESRRADMIVDAADFPERSHERVLIQGARSDDPQVTAAVRDVVARLRRIDAVGH